MLWPLTIVAAVGVVLGVALAVGRRWFQGTRIVHVHSLSCPVRHEPYDVGFAVTAWDGDAVDVASCTAFRPTTAVSCEKVCLPGRRPGSVPLV